MSETKLEPEGAGRLPRPARPKRRRKRAKPSAQPPAVPASRGLTSAAKHLLAAGAMLILGVAWVGVGESDIGKYVTLAGLIAMIVAIHRFGRLGPEEAAGSRT